MSDAKIKRLIKKISLLEVYETIPTFDEKVFVEKITKRHYHFSPSEVLELAKKHPYLFRLLVENGYHLSAQEIILIDQNAPADGSRIGNLLHKMVERKNVFSFDELFCYFEYKKVYLFCLADSGYFFTKEQLIYFKNPQLEDGGTLMEICLKEGHFYDLQTIKDVVAMMDHNTRNAKKDIGSLFIAAARNGLIIDFNLIAELQNPLDDYGASLAHWSARNGYRFTIKELKTFPEIINCDHFYFERKPPDSGYQTLPDHLAYQMRIAVAHRGATVAHIMAREGHQFTDEEIAQLGNPKDAAGFTIRDWQNKVTTYDHYYPKTKKG